MSHIFGQRVVLVDKREVLALEQLLHIVVETSVDIGKLKFFLHSVSLKLSESSL